MSGRILRVGTRGSRLALEQAHRVRALLPGPSQETIIKTAGDRFADQALGAQNSVGFFTKEIETALLENRIDLAVHSLKDLPIVLSPGLQLAALMKRDEAADVLLVHPEANHPQPETLPLRAGATVGASAMRRKVLLAAVRPDLVATPIRGNVPTRVQKCRDGKFDAIVLSRAGLARLALDVSPLVAYDLNPGRWICAPGQGVIAVEARDDDQEVLDRLATIDHAPTRTSITAERSLLLAFGGGCHAPFGAWAHAHDQGHSIYVAAPGEDDVLRIERFESAELEWAQKVAEEWVRDGRPARSQAEEEEWICRPAHAWC